MKIAIIGYSGSGKSTLAGLLGNKYALPVLYLDRVQFLPGWKERPIDEKLAIVGDFLDTHDGWVIDGNYKSVYFERRMMEADRIIFMNFNRFSCLRRVVKRYRTYKGKVRDSVAEGCDEKLDFAFVWWNLWSGRTRRRRRLFTRVLAQYPDKCSVIKNQRQLTEYIKREGL